MADEPKKKKKSPIVPIIIVTLVGALALFVLVYVGRVLKLQANAKELVEGVTEETFRETQASVIYDCNNQEISTLSGIKELYYVNSDQIPILFKQTFVQIEDQEFYTHMGIDVGAIIRAAITNASSDSIRQGASTITQQLAKNMFLTSEVTWNRKITEMFVAFELEKRFTKDQILEFYMNNIYFANGYYGVEAAAEGYFGVKVDALSISQMAFLAGIPNNPNKYDPIAKYDNAIIRRDSVLKQLYAANLINSLEYYQAIEEKIEIVTQEKNRYNYVETYVMYCATRSLMEMNGFVFRYQFEDEEDEQTYGDLYDAYYKEYQQSLFTGGYRIHTSIDMEKQELFQKILDDKLKDFNEVNDEGIYKMQGAGVCIDNSNGLVVAIVGGRSQDYDGYTLNRAYQSYRQPGSSIKPLLAYAPYMEQGHTPEEQIDDSAFLGGPTNFDQQYRGLITLREALGWSSNVCAWKLVQEMTPSSCMEYLHKMNYSRINMDDEVQATSIGGFTYGATPVEMAAAYATLENDGVYRTPTCISFITDSKGNTLIPQRVEDESNTVSVYTTDSSRMVTKMMEWGVNAGLLTGAKLSNAIVAAKSGSTNDNKDGWLAGYSKYYTTVVWTGMDIPESVTNLYGSTYPMYIWKDFMQEIHRGLKLKEFPDYTGEIETETTAAETEAGNKKENESHWDGGGYPDDKDGDFNHDVDVAGKGDQDANLGY